MKLYFIRHGDPDYEHDTITERGKIEAQALVPRVAELNADAYFCSPLGRARDTAAPSLKYLGKTAEIKDWLQEFNAPIIDPYVGGIRCPWNLAPSMWTGDAKMYDKDNWFKTELMSTGNVAGEFKRVCDGLDALLAKYGYERIPGGNNTYKVVRPNTKSLVFFCHLGISLVLMSHLFGISGPCMWQGFCPLPTSVSLVETEQWEKGIAHFRAVYVGDVSHLYAAGIEHSMSGFACEVLPE